MDEDEPWNGTSIASCMMFFCERASRETPISKSLRELSVRTPEKGNGGRDELGEDEQS